MARYTVRSVREIMLLLMLLSRYSYRDLEVRTLILSTLPLGD